MSAPDDVATPPPPSAAPPRLRRRWRRLRWWAAAVLALLLPLAALPWWLARSESGSAWLLGHLPGIAVEGPQGALLGERFAAARLRWTGDAGTLEIDGLALQGLQWRWHPDAGIWLGLRFDAITADRVAWTGGTAGGTSPPAAPPRSLRLPLTLEAPLRIGTLQVGTSPPWRAIEARLSIGSEGGATHRVDALSAQGDRGRVAGSLRVGADAPMAVEIDAELATPDDAPQRWQATLHADGPLAKPRVRGQLRGLDDAARADVDATLTPFAAFPLAALSLRSEGLDLSRLSSAWPETALTAEAELVEPAAGQPLHARVRFTNAKPGRWNERRLPLREGGFDVEARLDAPDRIALSALDLQLADAGSDAGRATGTGQWQGHGLTLELQLARLVPQRLDSRAPDWRVGGAVGVELTGLPSPDPSAAAAPEPWNAVAALALSGDDANFPVPVQLQAGLRAAAGQVTLERLLARAGDAQARLAGRLRAQGDGWALDADGSLRELDPSRWWPGLGEAWKRGPHRLNADLQAALTSPVANADWRRLGGKLALRIDESRLAGVPLQGRLAMQGDGALLASVEVGGNKLDVEGRLDRGGTDDRWQVALAANDLSTLAPLVALHPALAGLPSAGRAQAQGELRGRWPMLQGEGNASVQALRAGPLQVGEGELQFRAGSRAEEPLSLRVTAGGLRWATLEVPTLDAELSGTLAEHRLRFETALPLVPPEALSRSLALAPQRGTRIVARARGSLRHEGGGLQWSGTLQRVGAGAWGGELPLSRPAPREWLDLGPLDAEMSFDADGGLQHLRADGGRLRLADELGLVWKEVRYDGGALQLQATVEGFRIAPLLARWQPAVGWEGDLRVGASVDVALAERTRIDVVLERLGGDLSVRDSVERSTPLGLTDMRLALQAQDGTWTFTQALAGRTLGELGGVVRVHSRPEARWPAPDDALDGTVAGRVANLAVWGTWVPPGWRLEGALQTEVVLGGRFGAPELRGELRGDRLGVRNLLQGVHVRDGEVRVRLEGERATVDRFVLRGGDGTLTLTGGAALGAAPRADLSVVAERFQLLSRIDRRLVTSGRATLGLARDEIVLKGRFDVDEGLFDASHADAPSLDDDVVVRSADDDAGGDETAAAPRVQRKVDVAVDVDLGQNLRVRGRGLDTRLAGALRLSAPGGKLSVVGTVRAVDGTYAAYAQKLEIQRGELAFSGDAANPRLDILALRPNLDIEAGVAITGTAQSPRVRLYSNPELSESDKLSWLVLGRDPGGLGRADTALLQRAAVALLAGEGEAPTDALLHNLGLDEFSVRQDQDSAGASETIVSLGKQLSRRWYVGYERGVNATVGTWQLIYRVAQRFTLRAQSGAENSLDAIWTWRVP